MVSPQSNDRPRGVLVLCTGNSCRSQMAAAYIERVGGEQVRVWSGGTEPAPEVHPLALEVLLEDGLDRGDAKPRHYQEYVGEIEVDTLILVCGEAAQSCPVGVWPDTVERLHWPFEDPAALEGARADRIAGFRRIRDQIRSRVEVWWAQEESDAATPDAGFVARAPGA